MEKSKSVTTALGIELGSTRIKAVLTDSRGNVLASGSHRWENTYKNGLWIYPLDGVWSGLQDAYRRLAEDFSEKTGEVLCEVGCIGVSAMMHGYLAFDKSSEQIAEFRTWRNTVTSRAAAELTEAFGFNIPQRWSAAHLYQAILNGESNVEGIEYLTTLAGYVHYMLTGKRVLGIGDASGMLPIDPATKSYDARMCERFDELSSARGFGKKISDLLPKVLVAGEDAGCLTESGAARLDPSGALAAGIPFCPPEGDMQTGMAATNSVRRGTGNVSAGTSINACIIPERDIVGVYPEVDIVATPDGATAALLHGNNCCSEIDAWAGLFCQAAEAAGVRLELGQMLEAMFKLSVASRPDCGGMVYYNFVSGETVLHTDIGAPLFLRRPDARLTFAEFSRAQLYSALTVLRIGMDILSEKEGIRPRLLVGHGGYFTTPTVGQKLMSGALDTPIAVMKTAGEGGPWGMALLALYRLSGRGRALPDFLDGEIFSSQEIATVEPDEKDVNGFNEYLNSYKSAFDAELAAVNAVK